MNWLFSDLIGAGVLLLFSFVVHEYGHLYRAQQLGYKTKLFFRNGSMEVHYWPNVTKDDDKKVLMTGILFGLVVSLISVLVTPFWSPVVLIVYLYGCKYDWGRLKVLYRKV